MIIIYDFDGTITPYPQPKYEVFNVCNVNEDIIVRDAKEVMDKKKVSLYEAYFIIYRRYLKENNLLYNKDTVCLGADKVTLNKGVLEYLAELNSNKTSLKHYIVTAGFKEYILETPVFKYIDGVYGSTFKVKNGLYDEIDILMNDREKIEAIKEICNINKKDVKDVVYIGDGLTDKDAFEYVHNNGGKSILLSDSKDSKEYEYFSNLGIIDECFKLDYSIGSSLYNYISKLN